MMVNTARAAWQAYLAVDPSSAWANEAREHLKALARSERSLLTAAEYEDFTKAESE